MGHNTINTQSDSSFAPPPLLRTIAATLLGTWTLLVQIPPLGDGIYLTFYRKKVYHHPVEVTRIPPHFVGRREQFCLPYFKTRFLISQRVRLGHIDGSSSSSRSKFGNCRPCMWLEVSVKVSLVHIMISERGFHAYFKYLRYGFHGVKIMRSTLQIL